MSLDPLGSAQLEGSNYNLRGSSFLYGENVRHDLISSLYRFETCGLLNHIFVSYLSGADTPDDYIASYSVAQYSQHLPPLPNSSGDTDEHSANSMLLTREAEMVVCCMSTQHCLSVFFVFLYI